MRSFKGSLVLICLLILGCYTIDPTLETNIPQYTKLGAWTQWSTRVSTFNAWSLPVITKYNDERMVAVGEILKKNSLDFAFIQEAWTQDSRNQLAQHSGFSFSHYFTVPRTYGSGLFSLSNTAIERLTFRPFLLGGRLRRALKEGEALAGKGVGMTTHTINGLPISMFNVHTLSRMERQGEREDGYTPERMMNVFEVFAHIVEQTDSDAFIVAGDFNIRWSHTEYELWRNLTSLDGNRVEEFDKKTCTSCANNTFAEEKTDNGQIDFIWVSPRLKIKENKMDFNELIKASDGKNINLSDHYGWTSTIGVDPTPPSAQSQVVRASTKKAVDYLLYRIKDYLTWYQQAPDYSPHLGGDNKVDAQGIEDKFCTRCMIEDSIKEVARYQEALSQKPDNKLDDEVKKIRKRLNSYFSLFD